VTSTSRKRATSTTGSLIGAAQRLIAEQRPEVRGLTEPGVVLCSAVTQDAADSSRSPTCGDASVYVQILLVNGNHWVTVSCIAGRVTVSAHTLVLLSSRQTTFKKFNILHSAWRQKQFKSGGAQTAEKFLMCPSTFLWCPSMWEGTTRNRMGTANSFLSVLTR